MIKVKLFALATALIVISQSGGIATGQSKGSVEPSVVANAPLSELKVPLTDIRGEGSGEGGFTGDTNFSSGTAKVEPFGIVTYKTSWTDSPDSFTGNGTGGQCAHGSGTVVLTTPNGDQLTLSQTGGVAIWVPVTPTPSVTMALFLSPPPQVDLRGTRAQEVLSPGYMQMAWNSCTFPELLSCPPKLRDMATTNYKIGRLTNLASTQI